VSFQLSARRVSRKLPARIRVQKSPQEGSG
jgi:hypothetical protein